MGYTARKDEIMKAIEEAYKKSIQGVPEEQILHAKKIKYVGVLGAYLDKRSKAMAAGLKILGETGSSYTAKSQGERWTQHFQKVGQESFKLISDLDDDDEDSLLNVTVLGIATQESIFFSKLAAMPLGSAQGLLLESSRALDEEKKKLLDKWKSMAGSAKEAKRRAEETGQKVLKAFEQAIRELANQNRRAEQAIRDALQLLVQISNAPSAGHEPSIQDLFEAAASRLDSTVSSVDDVARLYRDAYKSSETTLVTIGQTRTAVQEFLEGNNLAVTLKKTAEAKKAAIDIGKSTLTKGQQDDGEDFAEAGGKIIQDAVSTYEKSYNQFITDFKEIFVGPIGNKALDQLLSGSFWEATKSSFDRLNFESELKKYYDEAEDMWDIPFTGVNDDLEGGFKDQFRRELREYDDSVDKAIRTYARVAREIFYDYPVSKLKDMASRSRGFDP